MDKWSHCDRPTTQFGYRNCPTLHSLRQSPPRNQWSWERHLQAHLHLSATSFQSFRPHTSRIRTSSALRMKESYIGRNKDMLPGINVDLLGGRRRELPQHNSGILLEGNLIRISGNVASSNHVRHKLRMTILSSLHRFGNGGEDVADGRLGVGTHHREFVRLRERQVDGEGEAIVDLELLGEHVQIARSYTITKAVQATPKG